jgi:hypothetical protein
VQVKVEAGQSKEDAFRACFEHLFKSDHALRITLCGLMQENFRLRFVRSIHVINQILELSVMWLYSLYNQFKKNT